MLMDLKSKYRRLGEGQYIKLTKEIKNNDLVLKPMTQGKIVFNPNQVEARIWFYHSDIYKNYFDFDHSFHRNGRFEGIVLNVKADSFAVHYSHEHSDVIIHEENALEIPFFDGWNDKRMESRRYRRVGEETVRQFDYRLEDIIDYIEDIFTVWVENECKSIKVTEEEKENGDYHREWDWRFTEESQEKFQQMQNTLELAFAKTTGFYYHFMGGTIED